MMVNSLLSTFSKTLKWKLSLLLSGAWDDPLDAVGLAALFSACEEGRGDRFKGRFWSLSGDGCWFVATDVSEMLVICDIWSGVFSCTPKWQFKYLGK